LAGQWLPIFSIGKVKKIKCYNDHFNFCPKDRFLCSQKLRLIAAKEKIAKFEFLILSFHKNYTPIKFKETIR